MHTEIVLFAKGTDGIAGNQGHHEQPEKTSLLCGEVVIVVSKHSKQTPDPVVVVTQSSSGYQDLQVHVRGI